MYEDDAPDLLKEMAAEHVMVEINLSSNEGILGVEGDEHPFPIYRAAHVPVALSTDDEGVSRIDLTHEYVRAAHRLPPDLRGPEATGAHGNGTQLPARRELVGEARRFRRAGRACNGQILGASNPTAACKAFLDGSEKAAAQWELERRFRRSKRSFRDRGSTDCCMDNERIREICLKLPHAKETVNWGHHLVYWAGDRDIGGKMFAMTDLDGTGTGVLWFHCGAERFHELLEREGIIASPHLARAIGSRWSAGMCCGRGRLKTSCGGRMR